MKIKFLILVAILFLTGCNPSIDDSVDDPFNFCEQNPFDESCKDYKPLEDTYTVSTYAEDVTFSVSKAEVESFNVDLQFNVDIQSISYSPIDQKLCVTFSGQDSGWQNATYFMILQDTNRYLTRQQIQLGSYGERFTNQDCMDVTDKTLNYQILIGKIDSDSYVFDPTQMEASAVIKLNDPHFSQRKGISLYRYTNNTPDFISKGSSYIDTNLSYLDEEESITEIRYLVTDTRGIVVMDNKIIADEHRSSNRLVLREKIEDLAPLGTYTIKIYITGNDGFDDYQDILIFKETITAAPMKYWQYRDPDSLDIYTDLYAYVYNITQEDDEIVFYYFYENKDTYIGPNGTPLELKLLIFDEHDQFISQYELIVGENSLSVPMAGLSKSHYYQIQDTETNNLYDDRNLPSFEPKITTFRDGKNIEIILVEDYNNIINVNIKIYATGYAVILEEYNLEDVYNDPYFTIYHDFNEVDTYHTITIEYTAYGETHYRYGH